MMFDVEPVKNGVRLTNETLSVILTDIKDTGKSRWTNIEVFEKASGARFIPERRLDLLDARAQEKLLAALTVANGKYNWDTILLEITQTLKDRALGEPPVPPKPDKQLRVTQISTVTPTRTDYLWDPLIPRARAVALDGDPGVGKSALTCKITAHLTSGKAFPNVLTGTPPPEDFDPVTVCLMTSEDDKGDTIRPRLEANGADCTRVFLIEGWQTPDGEYGQVTMQDLDLLRKIMNEYNPALLVFDPFQAYFGRNVDMNRANETRPVLDAIDSLCREYNCTPFFVRHVGKSRREAIHAGLGSVDITGVMRSELFLGRDPENEHRRILAHTKMNGGRMGQSIAYRMVSVEHDILTDEGIITVEAPLIQWDGLSSLKANDLSMPAGSDAHEERALVDQAVDFLRELLGPRAMLVSKAETECKHAGYTQSTIRRARVKLNVIARRQMPESGEYPPGGVANQPWEWALTREAQPAECAEGEEAQPPSLGAQPPEHKNDEHLADLEHLDSESMTYEDDLGAHLANLEHLDSESMTYEDLPDAHFQTGDEQVAQNQSLVTSPTDSHVSKGDEHLVTGQQNQPLIRDSRDRPKSDEHLVDGQQNQELTSEKSPDLLGAHGFLREGEHLAPPEAGDDEGSQPIEGTGPETVVTCARCGGPAEVIGGVAWCEPCDSNSEEVLEWRR
jgi:hypothetical protein